MAIQYVDSASAAGDSLTIPAHQAGDLLIIWAYNAGASSTVPTVPSGWISRVTASAGGGRSGVLAYRTATAAGTASGTWTDATHVAVWVGRSDAGFYLAPGMTSTGAGTSSAVISYSTIGAGFFWFDTWVIGFGGTPANDATDTPPSGMVNRTSTASSGEIAIHDTNGNVGSWATTTVATTSTSFRTFCFQIFETDSPIPSGGGAAFQLVGGGGLVY
jgi:hypothetical protein